MKAPAGFGVTLSLFLFSTALAGDHEPGPDVLRLFLDFKNVLQAAEQIVTEPAPGGMGLKLLDRKENPGVLLTEVYPYASGTLAKEHLAKIAVRPSLSDGSWEKVRYQLQIAVEPIEKRETRVTVDASIEALKRSFAGKEEWVTVVSNGNVEETFLLRMGRRLFGPQFSLQTRKKGFWERDSRYVPGAERQIHTVPAPDSRPSF